MKRKNTDSSNYKYDMYDTRSSKRSRPAVRPSPSYKEVKKRNRTWKEYGRQVVGTAAASTLGFIGANTGGAIVAGRKTWDYLAPNLDVEMLPENNMRYKSGGVVSKFGKPKKGYQTPLDVYQNNGVVFNKEVFGQVSSPDCVYIGHSTFDEEQITRTICLAILRKLFKKGGYNVTSTKETLPCTDNINNSEMFKFQIVTENIDTGATTDLDYETQPTDTLESISGANFNGNTFNFYDFIHNILKETDLTTFPIINHVILYAKDRYGSAGNDSNYRLKASLNMKNETMKIYSRSNLIVQNVTKGAESGTIVTEAIDAQPLKGVLYQFAGGVPQVKQRQNFRLNRMLSRGVFLNRAQDLTPAEDFKEPPNPDYFNNCYKAGKVTLLPGTLKKTHIISTWSGMFNNLMFSLTSKRGSSLLYNVAGKSQLVALEEELNSGSANLITTSYECEKICGVMFVTGPAPSCLAKHEELNYSLTV